MKVKLDLVGLDGNAFVLMGAFRRQALKEGYSEEEINTVLEEAKSGDYQHLLATLHKYTVLPDGEGEDEDDFE